ncbi:unnamed protein product [Penicillium crustosum]
MDLSTLGSLQQGTLFALLILGHAFPIFAFISLLRAMSFRTALKDAPSEEKCDQAVSQMPIVQLQEQMGCEKEDSLPAKLIDKAKIRMAVKEVQADTGLWNGHELSSATNQRHPDETQRGSLVGVNNKKKHIGDWKAHIRSQISLFKGMVQRSANHLSCRDSICCNTPDGIKYMALCLIAGLVIIYFIGFLILGIVTVGLWSKFVRPDIPREDKTSPFWAGAFLATSALCNNGMSLIDTNMGPYQKEWVCAYLYPTWHTWFVFGTIILLNALMWGAFEISAIHNEEIRSLPINFRVLDGLFQALGRFITIPC